MHTYTSAGQKSQPPGYRYDTGAYEHFQAIYVATGKLIFKTGGVDQILGPGGAVCLREGSAFTLRCEGIGYSGVYFVAIGEETAEFFGDSAAVVADPEMRAVAGMMHREITTPRAGSEEVLLGLGRALGWHSIRLGGASRVMEDRLDYSRHWVDMARQALEATVYTGRGTREVLAELGLSYRQLARHFKSVTGMSPKSYQVRARVAEAGRLLRVTALPVTTIAFELGYSSSQHFATQFQEVNGTTPSSYRKKASEAPKASAEAQR